MTTGILVQSMIEQRSHRTCRSRTKESHSRYGCCSFRRIVGSQPLDQNSECALQVLSLSPIGIDAIKDLLEKEWFAWMLAGLAFGGAIGILRERDALVATLKAIGEAKKGDVINFDYTPDGGTRITVNGQPKGNPIPGADFFSAVLRIWLGDKPADETLKKGMLGA